MRHMPTEYPEFLRQKLRERMDSIGNEHLPITEATMWKYWANWCWTYSTTEKAWGTEDGSISEIDLCGSVPYFNSYPWVEGDAPSPSERPGELFKVFVVGAGVFHGTYLVSNAATRTEYLEGYFEILLEKGFEQVRMDSVDRMGKFWERFTGHKEFLDIPREEWDLPHLIIISESGELKNYPVTGGEWLPVTDTIREIAVECNIPTEQVGKALQNA